MSSPTESSVEPDVVVLDLVAASAEEAVRTLQATLTGREGVTDAPRFLGDLLARMKLAPVCIDHDIALPHARTEAVSRIVLAVGRAVNGIAFDAEHPRVRLVFLIGTPKEAATEYLRVVAALSRRLRVPGTREALWGAADEAEFRAVLAGGVAAHR